MITKTLDERLVSLKMKHFIVILLSIISCTIGATSGAVIAYVDLKSEIHQNKLNQEQDKREFSREMENLSSQVAKTQCLLFQQNQWHMYKIKPKNPMSCFQ